MEEVHVSLQPKGQRCPINERDPPESAAVTLQWVQTFPRQHSLCHPDTPHNTCSSSALLPRYLCCPVKSHNYSGALWGWVGAAEPEQVKKVLIWLRLINGDEEPESFWRSMGIGSLQGEAQANTIFSCSGRQSYCKVGRTAISPAPPT